MITEERLGQTIREKRLRETITQKQLGKTMTDGRLGEMITEGRLRQRGPVLAFLFPRLILVLASFMSFCCQIGQYSLMGYSFFSGNKKTD